MLLFGLIAVSLSACAPRSPNAAGTIPPAPSAPEEGSLEGLLAESRSRGRSAEALLTDGELEGASSAFREALALLEAYLSRQPEAGAALLPEIEALRIRLDGLSAVTFDGRNGIDTAPEVGMTDPGILPALPNAWVQDRLGHYAEGAGRSTIELGLERMGLYEDMIRGIFREEGVPEELIHLAQAESLFNPRAVSVSAARGMWQFMPARGEEYGLRQNWWIDERSDPEKSTRAAARHLRDLFDEFGDWYLALAAYNAGPGRVGEAVRRAGSGDVWDLVEQRLIPPETRNYVPTVIAMAIIGRNPRAYGFDVPPLEAASVTRIPVPEATDLRIISGRLGLPLEELQDLNPHVLGEATPPADSEFELILPTEYVVRFETEIAPLAPEERILFHRHVVESGETLSYLARRYDIPVSAIVETNGLPNPDSISIGQALQIPLSGVLPPGAAVAGAQPDLYLVRAGDTLTAIASRLGTSVDALRESNRERDLSVIYPGDRIRIPAASPGRIE